MTLNTECHYAECHLCRVPFILSVANKPIMLSVNMLSVVMLSIEIVELHPLHPQLSVPKAFYNCNKLLKVVSSFF